MKRHLAAFVDEELFRDQHLPPLTRRRYFPTKTSITYGKSEGWHKECTRRPMQSAEQTEDIMIREALHVFKKWNPLWKPSHFMVNFSEAEMGALEEEFPDIHRGTWYSQPRAGRMVESNLLIPAAIPFDEGTYKKYSDICKTLKLKDFYINSIPPRIQPAAVAVPLPPGIQPAAVAVPLPPSIQPAAAAVPLPPSIQPAAAAVPLPPSIQPAAAAVPLPPSIQPAAAAVPLPPSIQPAAAAVPLPPGMQCWPAAVPVPACPQPRGPVTSNRVIVDLNKKGPLTPNLLCSMVKRQMVDKTLCVKTGGKQPANGKQEQGPEEMLVLRINGTPQNRLHKEVRGHLAKVCRRRGGRGEEKPKGKEKPKLLILRLPIFTSLYDSNEDTLTQEMLEIIRTSSLYVTEKQLGDEVLLSDFHREKAWVKWCRKKDYGVSSSDVDNLLRFLLNVTKSALFALQTIHQKVEVYHRPGAPTASLIVYALLSHREWCNNDELTSFLAQLGIYSSKVGMIDTPEASMMLQLYNGTSWTRKQLDG
ncbi:hypothetical protein Bbelb_278440 [Branchiostoma belcheri]|nr:hypothetical protein Bbelb_278440 [Branchiostoma belcheri]